MNLRHTMATLAATLLGSTPALAQSENRLPGFQLERLELNPSGAGSLLVGTGAMAPAGQLRVSLLAQHEQAPLTFSHSEQGHSVVIKSRLTSYALATWSATSFLELGLQVPFILRQETGSLGHLQLTAPSSSGLSTPSFHARLGLLEQGEHSPLDVALELGTGLPLGSDAALARNSSFRFTPKVMVGREFGVLRAGVEAGAQLQPSVVLSRDASNVRDEVGSELRMVASLSTTNEGLRGEVAVRGALPLVRSPASMEVLGGGRYALANGWEVFALGGMGFGSNPGTPQFRAMAGIAFGGNLKRQDSRKDCTRDGSCVTPVSAPAVPRVATVIPQDRDGDKVLDRFDNCPLKPGPVENQGCPGAPQRVRISEHQLVILDKVYFEFNKHAIQPVSYPLLDQVAQVLQEHPEFETVSIEGHTDNVGSDTHNERLSWNRAKAVRQYLMGKGVDGTRLVAQGFGEARPLRPNVTDGNRSINRRVEFNILTLRRAQDTSGTRVSFR
jgi:outer membrane protein OmpA-like peptidoglycan-associated protein